MYSYILVHKISKISISSPLSRWFILRAVYSEWRCIFFKWILHMDCRIVQVLKSWHESLFCCNNTLPQRKASGIVCHRSIWTIYVYIYSGLVLEPPGGGVLPVVVPNRPIIFLNKEEIGVVLLVCDSFWLVCGVPTGVESTLVVLLTTCVLPCVEFELGERLPSSFKVGESAVVAIAPLAAKSSSFVFQNFSSDSMLSVEWWT